MTVQFLLPFYGEPALLRQTVDSVLGLDDADWELTVVDDCYPEQTVGPYLEALGDPRIRYLRNERNLGVMGNAYRCLELAEHEFFTLLNADDLVHRDYLTVVRRAFKDFPDAALVQPGVRVVDEDGRPVNPIADRVKRLIAPRTDGRRELRGEALVASLLRGNWTYHPSLCWRRDAVAGIAHRPFDAVHDLALIVDVVRAGGSLVVDPTVCFTYRRHGASQSSVAAARGSRFVQERGYYREIAGELAADGWHKAARSARTHLTSRLHALLVLPTAVRARENRAAVRDLLRHALGRG
jgi:glycosyltransferase involved in cell wall biosynthesis